jgi:tetratricopeptide (TPR) repeat protein
MLRPGRIPQAEGLLRDAVAESIKLLGVSHPQTTRCQQILATVLREKGHYREAETLLVQLLDTQKTTSGTDDPKRATTIQLLADVRNDIPSYDSAEQLYQQALYIFKKAGDAGKTGVASVYDGLGLLYRRKERPHERGVV